MQRHVVVVGGGITGLAAAFELRRAADPPTVTVLEASSRLGGKILTTPFAGLPAVDAGADSVLARVPWAVDLLRQLGLADELVAPATGKASVWWHGALHPIPAGLVLGLPTGMPALARSRLLSWHGKARAAVEPLLPRTDGDDDLGLTVRRRFGAEVYDRLVGPLVGSINAADPDQISLAATAPQVADAAARHRSLLLGLRAGRPAGDATAPVFLTHPQGLGHVVHHLAATLRDDGVDLRVGHAAGVIEATDAGFTVGGVSADAVVLTVPAGAAATSLDALAPAAATALRAIRYASVAMVALAVPERGFGRGFDGSGYLVPAAEQRHVTACSWASSKWPYLRPDGQVLLRASLGRFGDEHALDLDDDALVAATLTDLRRHVGLRSQPTAVRVTRWPSSFPQYEPGHLDRVAAIEAQMPAGVVLAGAAFRGIGIASCIRQGRDAARATVARLIEPAKLSG
jgi:protoporphyrinogen/coproporphyrinogen III oxidase